MECFRIANGLNYERLHFDGKMVRPLAIIQKQVMTGEPISGHCPPRCMAMIDFWGVAQEQADQSAK